MKPNPVLKRLGFSSEDRVVIIHTDDIGMCHSSVAAYRDLFQIGIIISGAVMVPCPWFLAAVNLKNELPKIDLGVHLTLTSEWKTYRWGPISTRDSASGLIDGEGYFFSETEAAQQNANPAFARRELEEQIIRMLQAGLQPTHIDTHMGTIAHPKLMNGYIELALQYKLPMMMFRRDEQAWVDFGLDPDSARAVVRITNQLEEMQFPLLDTMCAMTLDDPTNRMEKVKETFRNLSPGITHFIIHPSIDSAEIRSITPDWRSRVADYETFRDESLLTFLNQEGIHRIGYRDLYGLISG
jgi:predicted glycoside hydrolase/deacetylase ChbG (UPF0249 family)